MNADDIAVRDYIDGKWQSVTLRECVEAGHGNVALGHILDWMIGLKEGEQINIQHIERALSALEAYRAANPLRTQ